jgi:hypothetical protein
MALEISPVPAAVFLAQEVFDYIWNSGGSDLTGKIASTLLATMGKFKRVEECIKMIKYFQEQKVSPKPFALTTAFKALCDAKEAGRALQLLEAMLNNDAALRAQDYPLAMSTAMKLMRLNTVTSLLNQMWVKRASISVKNFERVVR